MRALVLLLAAGCFAPDIPSGTFACALKGDDPRCPEGQVCNDASLCVTPGAAADAGPGDAVGEASVDAGKGPPDLEGSPPPAGIDGSDCRDDDWDEDEPIPEDRDTNGRFGLAAPLEGDLPLTEMNLDVCWSDDVDYYRVALSKGDRIQVNVVFAHTSGDLDAVLQDQDGMRVDLGQGVVNNEVLVMPQPAAADGEYRIAVIGYEGATNTYSLTVALLGP